MLRAQLREAGCRVTALDKAIAKVSQNGAARDPKQADILVQLAQSAELFHTGDAMCFADVQINGHRETWPIRSKGFRRWLVRRFYEATEGAPNSEALQSALNVLEATAQFDGPEQTVSIRVGEFEDRLYLDLCDESWRAVEITAEGWRIVDNPPLRFRRAAGMKPIPAPEPGGSIEELRSFLNVQSDPDFVLAVTWALAVLRNRGPYPVLVLSGEQGSAKSTFTSHVRALLDPNTAPLRALPRDERDLFIAACNAHVLAYDNISGLPGWLSDAFCRFATGGGFAVRALYTDQEEVLFNAVRPVILNGIEDLVTRPDLADRALFLTLEPISEERRRPERELRTDFEKARPRLLGALLDAVVCGLRLLPETRLERLPRMADFALWATACEPTLWEPGTFMCAYSGNRDEAVQTVIEADPVASAVCSLMSGATLWTGTAAALLSALGDETTEAVRNAKSWPATPRALSGQLRRAAAFLRKAGIAIEFTRAGRGRTRLIRITNAPENDGLRPSAPSAGPPKPSGANGFDLSSVRTVDNPADGRADAGLPATVPTVRPKPLDHNGADGADGTDANFPDLLLTEKPMVRGGR